MIQSKPYVPNPELDLVLERVIDVPKELVWKAWTQPEHVKKWFTPKPWECVACEIDLRPGGIFQTTFRSPDGKEFPPNAGCYLEVVENEKLIWTSALGPGFRPANPATEGFHMTAMVLMESHGEGTKYTAIAIHNDEESRKKHEAMGFHEGWGTVLDQLVEFVKQL